MAKKVSLIFRKAWGRYNTGEVAGFDEAVASQLTGARFPVAEEYNAKKHGKPGELIVANPDEAQLQMTAETNEIRAELDAAEVRNAAKEAELADREAAIVAREAAIDPARDPKTDAEKGNGTPPKQGGK